MQYLGTAQAHAAPQSLFFSKEGRPCGLESNRRLACLRITIIFLCAEVHKYKYHISVTTIKNLPFKSSYILVSRIACTTKAYTVSIATNKKYALKHEEGKQ